MWRSCEAVHEPCQTALPRPADRLPHVALDLPPLRTSDLDGPVAYREWDGPDGTTFVLLHGLGGSHLSWIQAAPGLAGLGRVLALDMPGFGRSPRAGRPTRLMDQRRILRRFLEPARRGAGRARGQLDGWPRRAAGGRRWTRIAVAGVVLTSSAVPDAARTVPEPAGARRLRGLRRPPARRIRREDPQRRARPRALRARGAPDPHERPVLDPGRRDRAQRGADRRPAGRPRGAGGVPRRGTLDHVLREEPVGGRAGDEQRRAVRCC